MQKEYAIAMVVGRDALLGPIPMGPWGRTEKKSHDLGAGLGGIPCMGSPDPGDRREGI